LNPNDVRHLKNIIVLIDKITQNIDGASRDVFISHALLADACAMNLIAIGEQVDRLTDECRDKTPQIEWRAIYGIRNRFAHDYFSINNGLLWDILSEDIVLLRKQLIDLIGDN
jgi:uncharacterized protein with HEPN domain